jgi:two-component system, NarL family, nitrate/nitrite response regulator NarL
LRVLVIHDSPIVGAALAELLRGDTTLWTQTRHATFAAAEGMAAEFRPDVILLDLHPDQMDVGDLLTALQSYGPIVALVRRAHNGQLAEAARVGVRSYALYSSTSEELLLALRSALGGRPYLPAAVATRLLVTALGQGDDAAEDALEGSSDESFLTEDERRVLGLLIDGLSNREIASELGTSERTVARRLRELYTKLHAEDRLTAVKNAVLESVH